MGSYHLWDYDWTPLSQNPCWNHTTILSLRDVLRISCTNTFVFGRKESNLYGIEWNGSIVAIVCRRLKVKEGLYEYELACSSESLRFSLSFRLNLEISEKFLGGFYFLGSLGDGGIWPGFGSLGCERLGGGGDGNWGVGGLGVDWGWADWGWGLTGVGYCIGSI